MCIFEIFIDMKMNIKVKWFFKFYMFFNLRIGVMEWLKLKEFYFENWIINVKEDDKYIKKVIYIYLIY